jgi:hypothetical protein
MTRITSIAKWSAVSAALAVAAIAGTASASAGIGPVPVGGLSAAPGCTISCITSAVVTSTASSASVKVTTSVPTSATVTVTRLDAQLGLTTGAQPKDLVFPTFAMVRTVEFPGLEPETGYRISVTARDMAGKKQTRTGTFETRAVKVAVDAPSLDLSAGLGCKVDCIEQGTAKAHPTQVGRVDFDIRLTEKGSAQLDLYVGNGNGGLKLERIIGSSSGITSWKPVARGLLTGTKYTIRLKATDAQGRSRVEWGSVRTKKARALVTFHSIKVIDDGETGRGEISFSYGAEDQSIGGNGFHKLSSGDSYTPQAYNSNRPKVSILTAIDGHRKLDVSVLGVECDNVLMKNCVVEAGHDASGEYGGDTYVNATAAFDLPDLINPTGALPPGYGTGLPAGHDGYLIWENTSYGFKFKVYATVDFEVAS